MIKEVMNWLREHNYKMTVMPGLNPEKKNTATVVVCIDRMTPKKCGEFCLKLDEWMARGVGDSDFIDNDGEMNVAFECPLDAVYRLMMTRDSEKPVEIFKSENLCETRGVMLDRFLHIRDNPRHFDRLVFIGLDSAHAKFDDDDEVSHDIRWEIIAEANPFYC